MGKYSIFLGFLVILFATSFCQADEEKATGDIINLDTFVDHFFHHIYKKHPFFKKPESPVSKPEPKGSKKPETGKKPKLSDPKKQEEKKSKPENKKAKTQEPKKEQPSIKKKPCKFFSGIPKMPNFPNIPKKFGVPSIPKIPFPPHAA